MTTRSPAPRKGARSFRDIPPEVLARLERGEIASASLAEFLAVDRLRLLEAVLTRCGRAELFPPVAERVAAVARPAFKTIHEALAEGLAEQIVRRGDDALAAGLAAHPSDIVRSWGCRSSNRCAPIRRTTCGAVSATG